MTLPLTASGIPELVTLGAAEAARRLREGDLSSTDLVAAILSRIAAVNPAVNAIRESLTESALAAASDSDRRLAAGKPCGPLDGVPITVKDNIDVKGSATTHGTSALSAVIAALDSPAIANLRRAGAIPVARTNMPDFALRWHTDSDISGPTINPWDPNLTPGGSSGGEAAALATGMSVLGVGNDLGGSLRWPAHCNGIAALRPSLGRVPHALATEYGARPTFLQLLDVQGPMARHTEDLRLAFEVMSAPDPRDPWHVPLDPHTIRPPHGGPTCSDHWPKPMSPRASLCRAT